MCHPEVSEFFPAHCVEVWDFHAFYYAPPAENSTESLLPTSPHGIIWLWILDEKTTSKEEVVYSFPFGV